MFISQQCGKTVQQPGDRLVKSKIKINQSISSEKIISYYVALVQL